MIAGGDLDHFAGGQRRRQAVVGANHVLEIVAVADEQPTAAERHRLSPDDRRPSSRHRPVVGRTQLFRVRLKYYVYIYIQCIVHQLYD